MERVRSLIYILSLVILVAGSSASAEVFVNGDFESGLAGWNQFGDTSLTNTGAGPLFSNDASIGVRLGPINTGGMFQTVAVTPNTMYMLNYWVQQPAAPGTNSITGFLSEGPPAAAAKILSLSGNSGSNVLTNQGNLTWTQVTVMYVTGAAQTQVNVGFAGYNVSDWWYVDNFTFTSMAATPEPGTLVLCTLGLIVPLYRRRKSKKTSEPRVLG